MGARLLEAALDGVDPEQVREVERARGSLPPGALEQAAFTEVEQTVTALASLARRRGVATGPPSPFEVDLVLEDGTRLTGVVPLRLAGRGGGRARVAYDTLKRKHHLAAWLDLMVLSASEPSVAWRSLAVGRSEKTFAVLELVPSSRPEERAAACRVALGVAVDCFRRGMREPLPLFPEVSYDVFCDPSRRGELAVADRGPPRRRRPRGPDGIR